MYTKSTFCKLPNHFKVAFKALLFFTFSLLVGQSGFATADIEVYYEYDNIILTTIPGEEPLIGIATYSVIVKNNGPDEATNLEIQMNYHDEVVVTDRNFSVGTWEGYYWAVPSLGAGETVTYTETSNIWVPYNNKWVMAFLVGADQPDPDSELNGASFDEDDADRLEIISPVCDLDLTLAVQGDLEFDEYEHVLYEVVVQNLGPHDASNVTVHFPLPAGMVYSASSATQGEFELYYETWNIGNLVSGQTVLLNLDLFTLDADAPKKAFAQVQTSDQPDPDSTPGNDNNQVADEDDEAEVTISPSGLILPDLAVFGLAPIPTGNYSGRSQTNEIYFDLRNIGAGSVTEEFQIGAYLSTDEFFSPDDVLLGDYNFPFGIDGGEIISELSFDAYVPYDQAPGEYFLLFYTDAQNTISEEDEINNIYVYPFEIRACAGIIDLESQAAVDAFGPCEVFDGTIYMSGDDITDFSSFDLLREVTGGLYLNVDNVETIAGFQNLETSNFLRITDCEDLVTLDAFAALREANWFSIRDNPNLENISSIDNLEYVGNNMNIQFNPKLSFCCNLFPILTSAGVQGETFISDNADFCNSPEQIIEECADFDYCTSLSDFPWHEWISLVQVNEIDNASEKSKYSDFTNLSTDLERGSTNAIHLQTGFSYYTAEEHWRVWIDFDQNGEFTDYAELVVDDFITPPPHGTANASLFSNISVPTNAKFGPTRMRVSMQRGSAPAPCGIIPFGEVEDYTVNIVPGSGVTLTMECPDDIFISLPEGTSATTVNWGLPSIDYNCPGGLKSLTQTGGQPSGTYLTAGVYFIEYTATDHCENEATCSFVITIEESSGYCDSESAFPWHEWISNVTLHNFSNPSGKSNYSDFTEHIIELEQQLSYSLILETSYSYTTYDEYWQVWIDYNQNGVFEEPSEFAFFGILERPADGTDSKLLSGNIFIPGDALPGPTRMRVSMKRGDYASPCETIPFGEVEDYTINISEYNNSPNSGNANRWTYSTIQSEDLSLGELRLFPNPAKTAINVLLDASAAGTGVIRIYDARGQMMLQKEIADVAAQAIPILLDNFENGLYFLSVQLENKKMRTSKFVVESKR